MSPYVITSTNRGAATAVARAVDAQLAVDRANAPTSRANSAILRANNRIRRLLESETLTDQRRAELRQQIRNTLPLQHKLDWHSDRVLRFADARRASLRQTTPDYWRQRIDQLPMPLRARVACIVWWDFFGERSGKRAWHDLDEYLVPPADAVVDNDEEMAAALISVGYMSYDAIERVSGHEACLVAEQQAAA